MSDSHEVTGSRHFLYSCKTLGGSCIPKGTAKSYSGGTTTRCFGQRECSNGFSCCVQSEYKATNSIFGKKRKRKKRQAVTFKPGRAIQCPSSDSDPKCGIPDQWNPEGGRCRKECKAGKNIAELIKPDPNQVCPPGNGCKCCFRQKKCKMLKPCERLKGNCRELCFTGETDMGRGCINGCTCCVPDELVGTVDPQVPGLLPACPKVKQGGRCTTKAKPTCDPNRGETLADDQYSCKVGGTFERKCCVRGPDDKTPTCAAEGSKCRKTSKKKPRVCDGSIAERDMTEEYPCNRAKGGNKKICCLKDCYHWRTDTWYIHGERHLFECEWAVCHNGEYRTYGQQRDKACCEDPGVHEYYENGYFHCKPIANGTHYSHYSQTCMNGSWVNDTQIKEECLKLPVEPMFVDEVVEVDGTRLLGDSSEEDHKEEENKNEPDLAGPPKEQKQTGMVKKDLWKKGIGKVGNVQTGVRKMGIGNPSIRKMGIGKTGIGIPGKGKKIVPARNNAGGKMMVKRTGTGNFMSNPKVINKGIQG